MSQRKKPPRVNLAPLQVRSLMDGDDLLVMHVHPRPWPTQPGLLWAPHDYTWPHRGTSCVHTVSNNPNGPRGWADDPENLPMQLNVPHRVGEHYKVTQGAGGTRIVYLADIAQLGAFDRHEWVPPSAMCAAAHRWNVSARSAELVRVDSLGAANKLLQDTGKYAKCPWVWLLKGVSLTPCP